jgi:hypothetical protein
MGLGDQRHDLAAVPPRKRHGTVYTTGWVGPRADMDGCGEEKIWIEFRTKFLASEYLLPYF